MTNQTKNTQIKETTVRKVLNHEISQLVAVVVVVYSFVAMVILPIKAIEKDIQNITGNHLMHVQDDIQEIKDSWKEDESEDKLLWMQIERVSTALDGHIRRYEK